MLSLRHHILFWVLSSLTLPLTILREYLAKYELIPEIVDDIQCPIIGLTLYTLTRIILKERVKAKHEAEKDLPAFSGNVIPAQLDELAEQGLVAQASMPNNANTNGNATGNAHNKRKKLGRKAKKRALKQNRRSLNQNGNSRQSNGNGISPKSQVQLDIITSRRLRKNPTGNGWTESMRQGFLHFIEPILEVLYWASLVLLLTRADLPGLEKSPGVNYGQMAARVLMTFTTLGTLEPLRCAVS